MLYGLLTPYNIGVGIDVEHMDQNKGHMGSKDFSPVAA